MKIPQLLGGVIVAVTLFSTTGAFAAVFTTNTAIGALDASYDGSDIVISNCTVTVDGAHSFNSVLVGAGGVLNHSAWQTGFSILSFYVANEAQVLNSTNPVTLTNLNVSGLVTVMDPTQTILYTNDADYVQVAPGDGTTQLYRTATSSIPDGATVLVSYTWTYRVNAGLNLAITNDVTVAVGGSINANGAGYGPALGAGRGFSSGGTYYDGSGAGNGGNGGMSSSNAPGGFWPGSPYQPLILGGGGGASYAGGGGSGGGKVQIVAGGSVNVFGAISANGADATNNRAGGGAGGSIWIVATNLGGAGSITANGGAGQPGHGGGGGGGRISIQCATNGYVGSISAYGGAGWKFGGAGTIFTQISGQTGLLVVDNGGHAGTNTLVALSTSADLVVTGGARVLPSGSFNVHNLLIATNSVLLGNSLSVLNLALNNLTVQAGGLLALDGLGYPGGAGTAPGSYYVGNSFYPAGGGGHGGYGAAASVTNANGGATYGLQNLPATFGSGGGTYSTSIGGAGGGVAQLIVAGKAQVDGRISANGSAGTGTGGGGGAGGSIYLTCGTFAGAGTITAAGGNGANSIGGGGGGGRVAVIAQANSFAGIASAGGGGGANWGGAGTVYLSPQFGAPSPALILDNGGHAGAGTLLQSASSANLIVRNGAAGTASSATTYASLWVGSNSWLTTFSPNSTESFTITGNATIQAGGGFMADSGGSGPTASGGGGYSTTYPYACGGGGHGGTGGNAFSNTAAGGPITGDYVSAPAAYYPAGAGGGYSPYSIGGSAGGYVRMTVNGILQLDGRITANGGNGSGYGGGGGGAGGIYLTTGAFTGSGSVSANGGNGANAFGGGGGGGMIAIYFDQNSFAGSLSAFGGGGANWGGAGTIYLKTNSAQRAQLVIDNAGHAGGNSATATSVDLSLRNGSRGYVSGSAAFGNLVIESNAWLTVSNFYSSPSSLTLNAVNVTVQAGGVLSADLCGYAANNGNGRGYYYYYTPSYPCSGAGHGGYGANSFSNAIAGGTTYDNYNSPNVAGSGGGNYAPYSFGGNGGGVIQLYLSGNLQVDGVLSANGGDGYGTGGGGGSGGALNLTCNGLGGSGTIAANGGAGANGIGGGGGGGVIAAGFYSNSFAGVLSAYGGGGANYGGAGTIYLKTNYTGQALFIVDNGGHRGTNTPLQAYSVNSLILRNGATVIQSSSSQIYSSLFIGSNAWWFCNLINYSQGTVNFTVTGGATIQAGGGILADGVGYVQNSGNGRGYNYANPPWYPCGGGGHGGYGGNGTSNAAAGGGTYDTTTSPNSFGSGGGGQGPNSVGGSGGGYVNVRVNGALQLDGTISANGLGGSGGGGGGSGGTINLTVGSLAGAGALSANGGSGANLIGGGGGGGRITIFNNVKTNSFTGIVSAFGGVGANCGGAGTVYFGPFGSAYGRLVLDNGNTAGTNTTFDLLFADVIIQGRAVGILPASFSWSANNVTIRTNSTLTAQASSGNRSINANSVTVDAGGALQVDGAGYPSQAGPGFGNNTPGLRGGGGHGGYGGGNSSGHGSAYDSIQMPDIAGSGGGSYYNGVNYSGGYGGGALSVLVNSNLTVNGRLSANGNNGDFNAGGGSGGSLDLSAVNQGPGHGLISGTGVISANGGAGTGVAGGGGGGRIAIFCTSNLFTGRLAAAGGSGLFPGGAGTVFSSIAGARTLLVDNGGLAGTNTPIGNGFSLPSSPFDLNISGAATVAVNSPLPLLGNLNLASGSTLTAPFAGSSLFLAVQKNANLAGNLNLDTLGFLQGGGPGFGHSIFNHGAGGGYGGAGGNAAGGATGGATYGSAAQPTSSGSGGGIGINTGSGGSAGGGAIRLSVGGTLNVDGNVSANGDVGWQDNSGGGSGGSIWITANTLSGAGSLAVLGGSGAPMGGGGGGGGRIAIYAPTNSFAGTTNVSGGSGVNPGQPGTAFLSSALPDFQIVSQSPNGLVNDVVSSVDLVFSDAVDPASLSVGTFTLATPAGTLSPSDLTLSLLSANVLEISFPVQNMPGNYSMQAAAAVTNIFGVPLLQAYTNGFLIMVPIISGTVSDTNGAPVAGVTVQPDGGLPAVTTDANGNYSIGVSPSWYGTITPAFGAFMFVPGSVYYENVTASLTNANFLMIQTIAPNLSSGLSGTNLSLAWPGLAGVTYQAWSSTNLVDWVPYGDVILGTNGPLQVLLPVDSSPNVFFRIGAGN